MNLYEKMSAVTSEIATVAKNLNVGYGKSSYKAAGEADVLAAVKPIEAKYKIYSYPADRKIIDAGELESQSTDYKTGQVLTKKQLYIRIQTTYRFVDCEKPEDYIDVITYGDGVDPQDKAPGKAMTYSDKYALMKAYKIQTGDDPDQYASEQVTTTRSTQRPRQTSRKTEPAPSKPIEPVSQKQVDSIREGCLRHGMREDFVAEKFGREALAELNQVEYSQLKNDWRNICAEWDAMQAQEMGEAEA